MLNQISDFISNNQLFLTAALLIGSYFLKRIIDHLAAKPQIDEALGEIQKSEVLAEGALIEALCQSSYNPSGEFGTINKVSTGVK